MFDDNGGTHGMKWIMLAFGMVCVVIGIIVVGFLLRSFIFGSMPTSFGWIWTLLGIFFFLWILSWIFRLVMWHSHGGRMRGDRATEILRRRYARGDITKAQFDKMMQDLQKK